MSAARKHGPSPTRKDSAVQEASFALLGELSAGQRVQVRSCAIERRWLEGELVFRRGDYARGLHLVDSGRFAIEIEPARILGLVGPGASFGELGVLARARRRSADVRALEPARTLVILDTDLERLRAEIPCLSAALDAQAAETVDRLTGQLLELQLRTARERVLNAVARLTGALRGPI